MTIESPASIHAFWFGEDSDDDALIAKRQHALWWSKNAAVDDSMRDRFAASVDLAAGGSLESWAETPRGRLALILLTDQFPRNIFRGTPRAFAHDHLARRWCVEGLHGDALPRLRPIERVFFLLPLEHSENLADQDECVRQFTVLTANVPQAHQNVFSGFLDFAKRHRDIIARFGRFPHRNAILGRESSDEEHAFLAEPGSSF